jgi:hypothetical protein
MANTRTLIVFAFWSAVVQPALVQSQQSPSSANRSARVAQPLKGVSLSSSAAANGQDEFVGISARIAVRTSVYSGAPNDIPTVFVGEPVEIILTLHNNTRQIVQVGQGGRDWLDQLVVDTHLSTASLSGVSLLRVTSSARDPVQVSGGHSTEEILRVSRESNRALEPGRYHLTVTLPAASLNRFGKNDSLRTEILFDVKSPETTDEQVDYYLHLAYHAKRTGDLNAEEGFLQKALQLHPASAAAHADLGQLFRQRHDCAKSRAEFEKAVSIVSGGGDPGLKTGRGAQEEWLTTLRAASTACR